MKGNYFTKGCLLYDDKIKIVTISSLVFHWEADNCPLILIYDSIQF